MYEEFIYVVLMCSWVLGIILMFLFFNKRYECDSSLVFDEELKKCINNTDGTIYNMTIIEYSYSEKVASVSFFVFTFLATVLYASVERVRNIHKIYSVRTRPIV